MTAVAATDEASGTAFDLFTSAANRYVTELGLLAQQASAIEPGTAAMLRAFAEREAWLALDLVGIWPTTGGPQDGR